MLIFGWMCVVVLFSPLSVLSSPFTVDPFEIRTQNPNKSVTIVHGYRLVHTETGQQAEVIQDAGGRLEKLELLSKQRPGTLHSVIQTHDGNATAIRTNPHYAGALLAPWSNRIKNGTYSFRGHTYYLPHNEVNQYRSDALHGFLVGRNMSVVGTEVGEDFASVTLEDTFLPDTYPGWPFHARVSVTYRLYLESPSTPPFPLSPISPLSPLSSSLFAGLSVEFWIENLNATSPLPFFCGQHPYFRVSDVSQSLLELDNGTVYGAVEMPAGAPRGGSLIPTGETREFRGWDGQHPIGGNASVPTYLDNEVIALFDNPTPQPGPQTPTSISIIDPSLPEKATLWGERTTIRTFHVFTGARQLWGWDAVAMEPMSAMADAYNNHRQGFDVVPGAGKAVKRWGIRLE